MKPRIVENDFAQTTRFPSASIFGTGAQTQSTEDNGLNGLLLMESLTAGRSFHSVVITLVANQWYCVSFEVVAVSGLVSGTNNGFKFAGTAPNTGDSTIDAADIAAGGVNRYACVFMDTVGGSFTYRLGVGLDSNDASKSLQIKNFMKEPIDINVGGFPSEYVYPQFKAAFNYPNYTALGANHIVTPLYGPAFNYEKGNVILSMGDSKSDETTDAANLINLALGRNGVGFIHAEGGWSSTDLVGPTTVKSQTCTSALAIAGTMLHRTFSTDGSEEMSRVIGLAPDYVVLPNFFVNDINAGTANNLSIDTALVNAALICDQIIAAGKIPVLTEVSPWNGNAAYLATNGDQIQTWALNRRLKELAAAKSALFVPIYEALGDSTDANKLSDGLGTTPDYSVDGLHLTTEGGRLVAALVLAEIQLHQQGASP